MMDLRALRQSSLSELEHLAQDLRQGILSACMKNGGHLGASLGAVELAIALHRVFESPREPIVWDVGHQAYAHKLLTGRSERFDTLRSFGGISGFPTREESEHDAFGTGHSSTALSAALAMAWARRQKGLNDWTVAIVGDGGLSAGLALEALNNFSNAELAPFLLVLNDNQMSISRSVGALSRILASARAKEFFDLLGFDYLGPLDGHDLRILVPTLEELHRRPPGRPVVLHALTEKGRGYGPAEDLPASFHGMSPLQKKSPTKAPDKTPDLSAVAPARRTGSRSFSDAFGDALCELAAADPRIVAISAAMPEGTGLQEFARRFPDRFFDVGIAEPHAVTFAAGLATQGYRPVVAIYSTFLQRGLDGIIHDVALQNLPVLFALDRAGLVGADGATHHGAFDLAYLGMIPNLRVSAPGCIADLRRLLADGIVAPGPSAIRYPRGGGPQAFDCAEADGFRVHALPEKATQVLLALGATASVALEAAAMMGRDGVGGGLAVLSTTQVKPFPAALVQWLNARPGLPVLTVEAGVVRGGWGQTLAAALDPRTARWETAGFGDHFIPHGSQSALEEAEGISAAALCARLIRRCAVDGG